MYYQVLLIYQGAIPRGRGSVVNVNGAAPIVDGCYFWASMTAYERTISIAPYSARVTPLHG